MQNKRGQGLSTNAIILIVLGIIVLVVLVLGFFLGWDTIVPWIKSDNNIGDIEQACKIACSTQSTFDFCTKKRTVELSESVNGLNDGDEKTCYELSIIEGIGIKSCATVDCPAPEKNCADIAESTLVTLDEDTVPPVTGCEDGQEQVQTADTTDEQICCIPED